MHTTHNRNSYDTLGVEVSQLQPGEGEGEGGGGTLTVKSAEWGGEGEGGGGVP